MSKKLSSICNYCTNKLGPKSKIARRCRKNKGKILKVGNACEHFTLITDFYCNLLHQRHNILHCMSRRLNPKGYEQWIPCKKKCRQFPFEIAEIIEQYVIGDTQVNATKPTNEFKTKKTIKRRKKKRIIERRSKWRLLYKLLSYLYSCA